MQSTDLVVQNPLSSSKALKFKQQTKVSKQESPAVKSLFDVKGNSKYKQESKDEAKPKESNVNPF